ncbi:VirD4-like conjugal transfer protein, CD1115 family [Vagococcus entomophilus]|uniref:Conjugal transfer protein TraG n=1 Tax=Vagococcus entomophilus TaxID=1160095 RepID=A0A430AG70_9ENTE|nr:type IV secretory system conjugative DNA transfer family protein [Vagococcus entomophilus]RSU06906.1 conjugal transfer protein TraG [Vagococcus entomophilus]
MNKIKKVWIIHLLCGLCLFYIGNRLAMIFNQLYLQTKNPIETIIKTMDVFTEELKQFSFILERTSTSLLFGGGIVAIYIGIILYNTVGKTKTRVNEEYGSAHWGIRKDIQPFIDKEKKDNILLTDTESLSLSGRMKITKEDNFNRNKNIVVVGGAGSGKTRFYVKPNLMQMHSSYVVSDSKGLLLAETGKMFEENGYKIKIFDLINRRGSDQYNPFRYLKNEDDILKIVNNLIKNTSDPKKTGGDPFFEKAETALLMAIFSYLLQEVVEEDQTLANVVELVRLANVEEDVEGYVSPLDILFQELEEKDPQNFAVAQYKIFKLAGGRTTTSILVSLGVRLAPFDIPSIQHLVSNDTLELEKVGDQKTILYILLPDTDTSFNFLASMMYQQLFDMLVHRADNHFKGRLPVHVRCVLDEFANIGQIPDFEKIISVIRSREISTNVILQNISQLKTLYKDTWETILGTSDTFLYLGGMEQSTHEYISKLLGKQTIEQQNYSVNRGSNGSYSQNYQKLGRNLLDPDEVASLKGQECILKIRGVAPFLSKKYNIERHSQYKKLGDVTPSYWYQRELEENLVPEEVLFSEVESGEETESFTEEELEKMIAELEEETLVQKEDQSTEAESEEETESFTEEELGETIEELEVKSQDTIND